MLVLRRFLLFAVLLMLGATVPAVASAQTPSPTPSPVDRTPGIQTVSPSHGPAAGGYQVRVGTRSSSGTVLFGGKPVQLLSTAVGDDFVNGIAYYYYTVVVPPGTPGTTVDVTVGGVGGVTPTANDFTYDVDASTEPLAWQCGSTFTFDVAAIPESVTIGGQSATVTAVDADTIAVDAPSPAFAAGPAYPVVAPAGRKLGVYRDGCFSPVPRFTDTSPGIAEIITPKVGGLTAGGNRVTVKVFGEAGVIAPSARLYFDGTPGTNTTVTRSRIVCIVACPELSDYWLVSADAPAGSAGHVDLSVLSDGKLLWGQTAMSNDYRYLAPPVVRSVTPMTGPITGGNTISILVEGDWIKDPTVTVGGVLARNVTYAEAGGLYDGTFGRERITATVPAAAGPGTVDVAVSGPSNTTDGVIHQAGGTSSPVDDFIYLTPPPPPPLAPVITGHGGGPGYSDIGGLLIVRGSNLGGLRSIKVGGRSALRLSATPSMIIAWAPPLAKGAYPVTVTTTTGTATAPVKYVYRSLF